MNDKTNNSTEAPASVTYSLTSKGNYNILFTVRGDNASTLLTEMELIEAKLISAGYKPQERKAFGNGFPPKAPPQIVPGRKCPLCGNDLIFGMTKDGRKLIKCSTQKYDFATKQSTGCKHFEWVNEPITKQVETPSKQGDELPF